MMLLKRLHIIDWFKKFILLKLLIVKKTDCSTKIDEVEKKINDHGHSNKYITTQEFNKLTSENFAKRLKHNL